MGLMGCAINPINGKKKRMGLMGCAEEEEVLGRRSAVPVIRLHRSPGTASRWSRPLNGGRAVLSQLTPAPV